MSTGRESGGDDDRVDQDLIRRYREANAALDERPSASARASILAAAAREVRAQPVDAAGVYRNRSRWPLAAAATVMLSTLAVMLAIRTNEEMPQFSPDQQPRTNEIAQKVAPAEFPPSAVTDKDAKRAKPAQPAAEVIQEDAQRQKQSQATPALNQQSMPREEASRERPPGDGERAATASGERVQQAPRPSPSSAPTRSPAPTGPAPASPAPPRSAFESSGSLGAAADSSASKPSAVAPVEAGPAAPKLRAQAAADASSEVRAGDRAADSRRDAVKNEPPQPSVAPPTVARQLERAEAGEPAGLWLERIIRLRREGRHVEADAELKRFRERYPQIEPPADAVGASGIK